MKNLKHSFYALRTGQILFFSFCCLLWISLGWTKIPQVVVQNRQAIDPHEWTLSLGTLPLDAFKKGLTVSGSYTQHYDHTWAWEAIQYTYSFPYETDLESQLQAFKLQPTPFERVESFVTSNLVFKPLYWKGSWLNDSMVYGELFFVAGGGYGWMTLTGRAVVDVGTGIKLFHSNQIQSRLDIRWVNFINQEDVHQELWIGLGLSL